MLLVDWDLEAPGLHRYLSPFLLDGELTSSDGIIDLILDFSLKALERKDGESPPLVELADITRNVIAVNSKSMRGSLEFLPAGRQGPSYAARVNYFNWQDFYERLGGGLFLEEIRKSMRREYDYVLIDSRTGVSDISSICTLQMPDAIVICFTLNNQSIRGAAGVANSIAGQRGPEFSIFPVPTRVELGEKEKLDKARDYAKLQFENIIQRLPQRWSADYWNQVETLYFPFYAYQEILAPFGDRPGTSNSLLASAERLTAYISNFVVSRLEGEIEQSERQLVVTGELGVETADRLAEKAPQYRSIYTQVREQQRSWNNSERKGSLLLPPSMVQGLLASQPLLNSLLEDSAFSTYWELSLSRIARRQRNLKLLKFYGVLGLFGCLGLFLIFLRSDFADQLVRHFDWPRMVSAGTAVGSAILGVVNGRLLNLRTDESLGISAFLVFARIAVESGLAGSLALAVASSPGSAPPFTAASLLSGLVIGLLVSRFFQPAVQALYGVRG